VYAGSTSLSTRLQKTRSIPTGNQRRRSLRYTPSSAFGSCRYKLKSLDTYPREYERLITVFKAHNIGYFF
jgi:hypothetical protein